MVQGDLYRDALEWVAKDRRMTNALIEDAAAKARL